MSLALLAPTMGVATHEDNISSVTPGGVDIQLVGGAGGVICDPLLEDAGIFDCSANGGALGGAAFDVSMHGSGFSNWDGSCNVAKAGSSAGAAGRVEVLCAVNRDDDTLHTNVDTSGSVCNALGSDPNDNDCDGDDHKADDAYDDMGYVGAVLNNGAVSGEGTSIPVCFAHDASEVMDPLATAHDWDTFVVFTSAYIAVDPIDTNPDNVPYVGTVDIDFSQGTFSNTACLEDTFGEGSAGGSGLCIRNRGVSDPGNPVDSDCGGALSPNEVMACTSGGTLVLVGEAVGVDVTFTYTCGGTTISCTIAADASNVDPGCDATSLPLVLDDNAGSATGSCTANVVEATVNNGLPAPDVSAVVDAVEHYTMVCKSLPVDLVP